MEDPANSCRAIVSLTWVNKLQGSNKKLSDTDGEGSEACLFMEKLTSVLLLAF